jgi:hypothetical protein
MIGENVSVLLSINSRCDCAEAKALDLRMFNHFRKIRGLCKPDQLKIRFCGSADDEMEMRKDQDKGQNKKDDK